MKANREHRVPLCRRAVEVLDAARTLSDGDRPLVFTIGGGKPLEEKVRRRLLERQRVAAVPHRLPFVVPGLGGGGDGAPSRGHRGGAGTRRREQGRSDVRAVGPVRAPAAADGRVGRVPRWPRPPNGRRRRSLRAGTIRNHPVSVPEPSDAARGEPPTPDVWMALSVNGSSNPDQSRHHARRTIGLAALAGERDRSSKDGGLRCDGATATVIPAVIRVHSTNHGPARRNDACGRRERRCCRVGGRVPDADRPAPPTTAAGTKALRQAWR